MKKNIFIDLRLTILDVMEKLANNQITVQKAAVVIKGADVIISTYRVELEQARLNGVSPDVKFIEYKNES